MIAVAVSGGRDSLLALALLAEAGEEVLALHAFFLPPEPKSRHTAEGLGAQCARLGVAFKTLDLSADFERLVIEPFVAAYAAGATPNPCAGCNRDVKFGLLLSQAQALGASRLATGHYARAEGGGLTRGLDPTKDQSYFLSLVPRGMIGLAQFPLGGWRKSQVMGALIERGLAPPLPGESQEVCFIPGDDYRAFLESRHPGLSGPGPITLAHGQEIGRHQGLWRYTIGQRRGLNLPFAHPLYVLDKLFESNVLVVGAKEQLQARTCRITALNILVDPTDWPESVLAQTSYRQTPRPARAEWQGADLTLDFAADLPRPTPGQVGAVYDQAGRVLAGGLIA